MEQRCGLITLYGLSNYGNRLQNYASQLVLESLGFDTYTILNMDFINKHLLAKKIIYFPKFFFNKGYRENVKKLKQRKMVFREFENEYIKEYKITTKDLQGLKNKFNYFVVGSDQVWNPYYMQSKDFYFLSFCDREQKITMSPSIGLNKLPSEYEFEYKGYLNEFNNLSCREQEGAEILKKLSNQEVSITLDPTMMICREDWNKIMKRPDHLIQKKFVILYFLGEITTEYEKFIEKRKDEGYAVINLLDENNDLYTKVGPCEFLWLINNSNLIMTDSFHACVFSIIFEKPFVVFERRDNQGEMTSRIYTLLNKFHLTDRIFQNLINVYKVNYLESKEILSTEREKSFSFLKKAFCLDD